MRRIITALPLLPLTLTACNGNDQGFTKQYPKLVALPENIDFGDVIVDYTGTYTLQIQNAGQAPLSITNVAIDDGSGVFTWDFTPTDLAIDDTLPIEITFAPHTYLPYAETLYIYSDDKDFPQFPVRLFGEGVDGPKPDIQLDALSVDFGTVAAGSSSYQLFTVYNVGDADLEIGHATLKGSGAFTFLNDIEGQTLSAGSVFSTIVLYDPTHDLGDNADLTIESNDPDEPSVQVQFLGNGGGDFDYPEAVLSCPDEATPLDTVFIDASESYDPNENTPLTYEWELSRTPEGSRSSLSVAEDSANLYMDLAGDYTVSLAVTNSLGIRSAPAKCYLDAIPDDFIHVELVWNTSDSDLDLHLSEDSASIFEKPGDCNFCNPNPSWGAAGDTDDPRLDLDDISGYGPENINIEEPAVGDYDVRVHYFEDNGGGATVATVRFYIYGLLEEETSQILTRNEVWEVGTIRWDLGYVVLEELEPASAANRSCY